MVYFMQSVNGGAIKIGYSADVDRRREQLEGVYGTQLAVLATLDGGRDEEQKIHARFSHLRFGRTEQFKPDAELMAFIGRPLLVDQNSDAVEAMPTVGTPTLFAVKGRGSWYAWLKEYGAVLNRDAMGAIDHALREQSKREGFREMPKRVR